MSRIHARLGGLLALALFCASAQATINVTLLPSFDGTRNTKYPLGDKAPPADDCLTGWTCAHLGNGSSSFTELASDSISVTSTAPGGDDDGIGAVYKTFASESNRHIEARIDSVAGNPGDFSGGGIFMAGGTDFGNVYKSYDWWRKVGRVRCKTDVGGASEQGQIGATGVSLPYYVGFEYDAATNSQTCWESANGTTWVQIGGPVVHDFQSGIYGVFATSHDGTQSATTSISAIVQNTTLSFFDDPGSSLTDTPDYQDPVAGITVGTQTVVAAANSAALTSALANAQCGQTIQLSGATYAGNFTANKTCTNAASPLIIKGAASFASVATGAWTAEGRNTIVTGIDFNGSSVQFNCYGINNKFVGNKIRNYTGNKAIRTSESTKTGLTQCEIGYNVIGPFAGAIGSTHFGVKADTSSDSATVPTLVWVHHNDFNGHKDDGGNGNDTDFVEPGNSSHSWEHTFNAGWYFDSNLFRDYADCNKNAIDLKFSFTVIRRNTINNTCVSKFTTRIGSFNILDANYLNAGSAVGQILTQGQGNKVVCNSGSVRVQAGSSTYNHTGKINNVVPHDQSYQTLVAGNNGALVVGEQPNSSYSLPALETTIEDHTGSVDLASGLHTGTADRRNDPSSYKCVDAVQLTTSDVGPGALSVASSQYLNARGLN